MRLKDKVGVITGGGSGLGRATALKFANEGAKVVIADMNEVGGQETVDLIQAAGGEAVFVQTDVSCYEQVEGAVNLAVEQYGSLDIMFNNAGINIFNRLLDYKPEDYDKVVKVNQYGVFYGIQAAGKKMSELGSKGIIINTASVASYIAYQGTIAYLASKAAVKLMTQSAALELGELGIRVVAIAPGGIDTPFIQFRKELGMAEQMAKLHIRGELYKPEQIADVVTFLASKESDAINGSTVMVEDGLLGSRN